MLLSRLKDIGKESCSLYNSFYNELNENAIAETRSGNKSLMLKMLNILNINDICILICL